MGCQSPQSVCCPFAWRTLGTLELLCHAHAALYDLSSVFAYFAGYTFPYLYDESQQVAKSFKAVCTPEFYIFDSDLKLAYHGQFDASRPRNNLPVTGMACTWPILLHSRSSPWWPAERPSCLNRGGHQGSAG